LYQKYTSPTPNAKILILVKNLQHIENLQSRIKNCYTIEGKDDIDSRYDIINKFVDDEKPATIVGTNVMQTGISIDEITHMINARGLSGEVPTLQGLGYEVYVKQKAKILCISTTSMIACLIWRITQSKEYNHYKRLKFEVHNVRF
jgi:hypothetical protein